MSETSIFCVSAVSTDADTQLPVAVLADAKGDRTLILTLGLGEACAIVTELERIDVEHPLPHQLLSATIDALGAQVVSVTLETVTDELISARVDLRDRDGHARNLRARPSDALALALRRSAPIQVCEEVALWLERRTARMLESFDLGCCRTAASAATPRRPAHRCAAASSSSKWKA